jgi:hypothetical protein
VVEEEVNGHGAIEGAESLKQYIVAALKSSVKVILFIVHRPRSVNASVCVWSTRSCPNGQCRWDGVPLASFGSGTWYCLALWYWTLYCE